MTAILIHGCHLQAEAWEDITFGDPQNGRLGRVPKGILEALKWNATTVVFSTGASERDGLKEGEYVYRETVKRSEQLAALAGMRAPDFREWLEKVHILELTSQTTRQEIHASARLAKTRGESQIVLVSSPTHIMRCHQAALSVLGSDPELRFFLRDLYAVASDTSFANSTVDDVVIIEPPHRGDMPKVPYHATAKGIFQFLKKPDLAFAFNDAWKELIDDTARKL